MVINRELAGRILHVAQGSPDPVGVLLGALLSLAPDGAQPTAPQQSIAEVIAERDRLRSIVAEIEKGLIAIQTAIAQAGRDGDSLAANLMHIGVTTNGRAIKGEHVAEYITAAANARAELSRLLQRSDRAGRMVFVMERFPATVTELDSAWVRFAKMRAATPGDEGERAAFRLAFAALLQESPTELPKKECAS